MKHLSHFIQPEAKFIETNSAAKVNHRNDVLGWWTGDLSGNQDNFLAFENPDKRIAVVMYNGLIAEKAVSLRIGNKTITPTLKPKSFNTFLVK